MPLPIDVTSIASAARETDLNKDLGESIKMQFDAS
jgi:hypothetical protein